MIMIVLVWVIGEVGIKTRLNVLDMYYKKQVEEKYGNGVKRDWESHVAMASVWPWAKKRGKKGKEEG